MLSSRYVVVARPVRPDFDDPHRRQRVAQKQVDPRIRPRRQVRDLHINQPRRPHFPRQHRSVRRLQFRVVPLILHDAPRLDRKRRTLHVVRLVLPVGLLQCQETGSGFVSFACFPSPSASRSVCLSLTVYRERRGSGRGGGGGVGAGVVGRGARGIGLMGRN